MKYKIRSEKQFFKITDFPKNLVVEDNIFESLTPKLLNNKDFLIRALNLIPGGYKYISSEMKKDKDIILAVITSDYGITSSISFDDIPDNITDDYFKAEKIIDNYARFYLKLSERLRKNENLFKKALYNSASLIVDERVPEEFRTNIEYIKIALKRSHMGHIYERLPKEMQENREVILSYLTPNGYNILNIDEKYLDDEEIAMTAIKSQNNDFFTSIARKDRDQGVLAHISPRLQNSKEFILDAIKDYPKICDNILSMNSPMLNDLDITYAIYINPKVNLCKEDKIRLSNMIISQLFEKLVNSTDLSCKELEKLSQMYKSIKENKGKSRTRQ